jgi:S1-C subfamily serine protease
MVDQSSKNQASDTQDQPSAQTGQSWPPAPGWGYGYHGQQPQQTGYGASVPADPAGGATPEAPPPNTPNQSYPGSAPGAPGGQSPTSWGAYPPSYPPYVPGQWDGNAPNYGPSYGPNYAPNYAPYGGQPPVQARQPWSLQGIVQSPRVRTAVERTRPYWRYAPVALLLLVVLIGGIILGSALVGARSHTTGGAVNIGASAPPITSVAPAAQDLQQTIVTTVNAVQPSVVEVTSTGGQGQAIGSGEILTKDGYVVTNDHVVDGFSSFSVRLSNGQILAAQLVGQDAQDDLAVLKINVTNATPIAFADSDKVQVGQFAIALGSPLGLQDSVTFGIVSALNRTASESPQGPAGVLTGLIQTSAPINPGNSGGALVDLQGQLIGIPTLGATNDETGAAANGIGFAIPSNRVKYVSQQLIANGKLTTSGQGYLGIQGRDVSPSSVTGNGSAQSGVQVMGFVADANGNYPAQAAGVQIGDIITAVDGQPVTANDDLASALLSKAPSSQVTLTIERGSSQITVKVTLGERPVQG